jgi:N-acetylneuraminic acid mutarotase
MSGASPYLMKKYQEDSMVKVSAIILIACVFAVADLRIANCQESNSASALSGTWESAPTNGFTARSSLTACAVNDTIYTMGGYYGSTYLNTVELFDLKSNTWSTPVTTGTFTPRRGLTSALVSGKIYVLGGYNGVSVLNTLEVFDPTTNKWTTPTTTGTFTPREKLCCAVVDGKIYAMGGYNGSVHLNALEVFDPSTNTWSTPGTTGTFTPRRGLAASVIAGKIYVMGGYNNAFTDPYVNTLELYEPATRKWTTPPTTGIFTARGALCSSVIDSKIYAMGGVHLVSGTYIALNTVEVFDPATNTWTTPTTVGTFTPRYSSGCSLVLGKIHVIGGENVSTVLKAHETYTPLGMEVKSTSQPKTIELFPNPTTGIVWVRDAPEFTSRVTVSNILGKILLEAPHSSVADFTLNLTTLPSGVYFVKFFGSQKVLTKMIVRE